jgi:exosortase A-associated hydrolase 1
MGDSEGESGTPEPCEHLTDDLHAAIDAFFNNVPTLKEVILWGLCDGASAALLYAHGDARVSGVALINPWVSTQGTPAKTYLKHYYARRVLQGDFWRKLLRGDADVFASLSSFGRILAGGAGAAQKSHTAAAETPSVSSFQDRMADGLSKFSGRVLLVLSGNDLIAAEFKDMISASKRWNKLLRSPRVTRHDFAQADHTFSCRAWRDQVAAWTRDWIRSWP